MRPLIFRSGSMSPEIGTGALALAQQVPATDLAVGDVVSVLNARGVRITHRIRTVEVDGPVATLVLQGDANPVPDAEPYVVTRADRLFFHIDHLGYVIAWLGHRYVVFGAGVLVGVLGAYAFRPDRPDRAKTGARRERKGPPDAAVAAGLVVAIAGALLAPHATGTMAAFTDGGSAATGTFASRYWRCDTVILADAPRIYYKLNETGTTTTAADSSGN
ncbi:MAG TPA: signal peptidase I, partial [Friedmanniella sp.]